jgi:hypothetical protein
MGDDTEKAGKLIGEKIKMKHMTLANDVMQDISGKTKSDMLSPISVFESNTGMSPSPADHFKFQS